MRVWLKRTGQVDGTSWREQKVLCVVNAGSKMGVPLVYLSMWGRRVTSTSSPLAHRVNTTSRFSSMLGKKGDKYIVSTNAQILSISGRTVFPVSPASVADVLFQGIPDWRRGDRGCSSLSLRMCKWPIKPSSSRASLLVGPASFVHSKMSFLHARVEVARSASSRSASSRSARSSSSSSTANGRKIVSASGRKIVSATAAAAQAAAAQAAAALAEDVVYPSKKF